MFNGCSVNSFVSSLAIAFAMRPVKTLNKNTQNYFILYLSFQKTQLCSYGSVGLNTFPRWRKEIFRSSSPVAGTLTKLNRVRGGMHSITVTQKVQVRTYIWISVYLKFINFKEAEGQHLNHYILLRFLDIICWVINHHFVKRKTYTF